MEIRPQIGDSKDEYTLEGYLKVDLKPGKKPLSKK